MAEILLNTQTVRVIRFRSELGNAELVEIVKLGQASLLLTIDEALDVARSLVAGEVGRLPELIAALQEQHAAATRKEPEPVQMPCQGCNGTDWRWDGTHVYCKGCGRRTR